MRKVGLHLRLTTTLADLLDKAKRTNSPVTQCFLVRQSDNKHIEFSDDDIAEVKKRRGYVDQMYLHASYWVNLAGCRRNGWRVFQKELDLADKLEFSHIIIHPGSSTGCATRIQGVDYLARALNKAFEQDRNVKIVLENVSHAKKSIGGDLQDFKLLLEKLDKPEKVSFCLDTAHAYSFGYDVSTNEGQDKFFDLVKETIPQEQIALIHLNDTQQGLGKYVDQHAVPGTANIGKEALDRFVNHPMMSDVPIILELPVLDEEEEIKILQDVTSWSSRK